MPAQNETVAAVLADLKILVDSDALESVYARLESALTKAEAVEPVAEVYEWHTCGRDALGEAYRQSKGVAMRFIGPALPIGTKLYAHAVPVGSPASVPDGWLLGWARPAEIEKIKRQRSKREGSAIAVFVHAEKNETYSAPVYAPHTNQEGAAP